MAVGLELAMDLKDTHMVEEIVLNGHSDIKGKGEWEVKEDKWVYFMDDWSPNLKIIEENHVFQVENNMFRYS